ELRGRQTAAKRAANATTGGRIPVESRMRTPGTEVRMWAYSSGENGRNAPVKVSRIPNPAPAATRIQPADRTRIKVGIKSAASTNPATTCPSTRARYGIVAEGNA